ncbi:MAG: protein-L-isoaspartate O-methyltransferase, partial [Pseudomonadota bacterium]
NGWRGWPEQAPFSRILVTAAAEELPQMLWQQLGEGGHMVVPIGQQGQAQDVVKISRINGTMMRELVTPAKFVPMVDEAPVKSG